MPRIPSARRPSGRRHLLTLLAPLLLVGSLAPAPDAEARWNPVPRAGLAAPTTDLPGWKLVFRDDFSGNALDTRKWGAYKGGALSGGGTLWDPSHVKVGNGRLTLLGYQDPAHGGKWVTGGVGSKRALSQTYGKYLVRMRLDDAPGLSYAVLLYPTDNNAPPEIDFAEGFGKTMRQTKGSMHHGTREDRRIIGNVLPLDMTRWHVLGVEWTPGRLVYTVDGRAWATVTHPSVPSRPMVLDIQTQTWSCGQRYHACPSSSSPKTMDMQVDWAAAYAWSPATAGTGLLPL